MTNVNLHAIVSEILAETDLADPGEVAEEAFARIPVDQQPDMLRYLLRSYARNVMAGQRKRGRPTGKAAAGGAPNTRSWKRDGLLPALNLDAPYHVGESQWKRLRDLTRDDLLFAVQERRDLAARNTAEADWLQGLANQLAPGQTVGELYSDGEAAA